MPLLVYQIQAFPVTFILISLDSSIMFIWLRMKLEKYDLHIWSLSCILSTYFENADSCLPYINCLTFFFLCTSYNHLTSIFINFQKFYPGGLCLVPLSS